MSPPEFLLRKTHRNGFTLVETLIVIAAISLLTILAVPAYQKYQELNKLEQAINDIGAMNIAITKYQLENNRLPSNLSELGLDNMQDPWGMPYQYITHKADSMTQQRINKNLVAVNNDYDLYSTGKNRLSEPALSTQLSHDDIVRANNGKWIGLGKNY